MSTPRVVWLGRVAYRPTWDLQRRCHQEVLDGGPERLLLCEHEPVITLGRRGDHGDVLVPAAALAAAGIEQVVSDRGGQATYHGPGQLVAYPIRRVQRNVLAHVLALGESAVAVAAGVGVTAELRREPLGIYVGARKLAAIGVSAQGGVTTHGLAINVTGEASAGFRRGLFHPCGQVGGQVTSLAEERGEHAVTAPTVAELVAPLARALCRAFGWPEVAVASEAPSLDALSIGR